MFYTTVLLAIMGLIGTDIYAPSLPNIATAFHQPPHHIELTISLFLSGFAVSQLFYGPFSDRFGRKPPLITGVLIFIVGSIICVIATHFTELCLGRIIQGIGVGAGLSLARVILRDSYQGTTLAIRSAQIGIFVSLTPAIAPLLGGILQEQFNYHASFIFMLCYGLVLLFLLLTVFKETNNAKDQRLSIRVTITRYVDLLNNHYFIRHAIISGLAFASIVLYANIVPFIVQNQLKLSAAQNGVIMLIAALGVSSASFISSRAVKIVSSAAMIKIGLFIYVINGLLLIISQHYFGTHLPILIFLLFLITMACGFIFPNAIALCFSKISINIGIAGAIYGSVQIVISMLINFLLNAIPTQNQHLMGMFYLIIGIAGLMIFYYESARVLAWRRL